MNHKFMPAVAAFLILGILLSATQLASAATVLTFGPKLDVVTIPQDDQVRETGIIILGIDPVHPLTPNAPGGPNWGPDLMSQQKIIVTYNGATLMWQIGTPGPTIACNILQKDKVNVAPDPKTGKGQQGSWENLMTTLVDVSNKFVCKGRWKSPAPGVYESVGVLDVYYVGPLGKSAGVWIADDILTVEAFFTVGQTVVFGSDIQDICVIGWAPTYTSAGTLSVIPRLPDWIITKPDGSQHYVWKNAMGSFVSCEELALVERDVLGIPLATGQDPLSTV
jgi:hypothetical protein